jgi:hypothetical protein
MVTGLHIHWLDCCGVAEVERMAHDVGVNAGELCALAGKWPHAAEPLIRRLAALDLHPDPPRRAAGRTDLWSAPGTKS